VAVEPGLLKLSRFSDVVAGGSMPSGGTAVWPAFSFSRQFLSANCGELFRLSAAPYF
jgi:hypothetical protein